MGFRSKRERIAFVIMVVSFSLMAFQIMLFSLSSRYEIEDFSRCLLEPCRGEFLNETIFWLSLWTAIISASVTFAWEKLYVPVISWIETGKEQPQNKSINKNIEKKAVPLDQPGIYYDVEFSEKTKFLVIGDIPVTCPTDIEGLGYCMAWDTDPPRELSYEDVRQNDGPISKEVFQEMVEEWFVKNGKQYLRMSMCRHPD